MSDESIQNQSTPKYSAKWWMHEISLAEKELDEKWRNNADKIVDKYLAEQDDEDAQRLFNVFWANTQILKSALYGTPPKPRVTRQFGDSKDDVARVAALMLERILQFGMVKDQSDMHDAFSLAADDRLITGLGQVWLRYEAETAVEDRPDPLNPGQMVKVERIVHEQVITEYVHWRDFIWSPARIWSEVWWAGRRVWLTRKKMVKRFGEKKVAELDKELREVSSEKPHLPKGFRKGKYEIFEIWCIETNKVYWVHRAMDECLDEKDDPYQLEEFYPFPQPLLATHTSKTVIPRPDYSMVQDQYEELNVLNTRIYMLTESMRVVGVYDKSQAELSGFFRSPENRMIAVDNWAALGEKGGLKGVVDWFPIDQVAAVLEKLMLQRSSVIQQIYELTSISDIMRGASNPRETLGAQKLKSQFSSVRLQLTQQDVGKFVRHAMRIKAEMSCNLMQPQTLVEMSGIMHTDSAQIAPQAVELLKNYKSTAYRLEVSEETLSIADYNAERELRTEFLTAVGQFLSQAQGTTQAMPQALPYLLRMVQWLAASFRGSADIETVLDEAINMAANMPPPQNPEAGKPAGKTPEELQFEMQKTQMTLQAQDKMNTDNNQTKVLIKQMELGMKDKELEQEAIGMQIENDQRDIDREVEQSNLAEDRVASASEAERQREHDWEQNDANREATKQSKKE